MSSYHSSVQLQISLCLRPVCVFIMVFSTDVPPSLVIAHPVCGCFYSIYHLTSESLWSTCTCIYLLSLFIFGFQVWLSLSLWGNIYVSPVSMVLSCFNLHTHVHFSNFLCSKIYQIPFYGRFPVLIKRAPSPPLIQLKFFPICTFNVYDSISTSIYAFNSLFNLSFLFF